ncbi:MAG: SurA N-terminal domain-containing protein [Candidatus Levybacteria bacterium]|nr:SurA N-terminal domain-containing protein [Candidatus Levybacteria bacterium]
MPSAKTKSTSVKKTTSSSRKTSSSKKLVKSTQKATIPLTSETSSSYPQLSQLKLKKRTLVLVAIAIALVGLAVYYRSLFVVAMVNGQPISRITYINETEAVYLSDARVTAGKQALNQLVTKALIYQEADKKNISVADKEVKDEVARVRKTVEKQNQKLEEALAAQGDTLKAYEERIKIQKLLEKLVGKITVSDKEVNDYIEKNNSTLPQDISENDIKTQVKSSLEQQKFSEKVQTLISDLQKKAKVTYLVN